MKSTFRRWLPAIMRTRTQALLGLVGLAIVGVAVAVAGPAPDASATPDDAASARTSRDPGQPAANQAGTDKATADKATAAAAQVVMPAAAQLNIQFQLQPNYYYCAPAATRIALSAHGKTPSQDKLAKMLGTTTDGTNSTVDVTRVLNSQLGADRYHTREISSQSPKPAQMDQLQSDIATAVDRGDVVVANVAGTVMDSEGNTHSYRGGHYLTAIGYRDQGRVATIADPADPDGDGWYQLSTIDLANWIATRGYAY